MNSLENLKTKLELMCYDLDKDNEISNPDKIKMADSLSLFCFNAISKFLIGQKKHGGKIIDKDLDHEFNQEFIDMFWYMNAKIWKQNEKEKSKNENSSIKEENEVNTAEVEQQSNSSRS